MDECNMLEHAMIHITSLDVEKHAETMHEIEHEADELKREMISHLLRDFIPSIDREDVLELANTMDLAIDAIENVMKTIRIYNIKRFSEEAFEFLEVLKDCVEAMTHVIEELHNFKHGDSLNECIQVVKEVEQRGDRIYMSVLTDLFSRRDGDFYDILSRQALFQSFEDAVNACEKVAYEVEVVQIKNR